MNEATQEPLVVTINQAASLLSVNRATIYRMIQRGDLDVVMVGERRRIRMSDLHKIAKTPAHEEAAGS